MVFHRIAHSDAISRKNVCQMQLYGCDCWNDVSSSLFNLRNSPSFMWSQFCVQKITFKLWIWHSIRNPLKGKRSCDLSSTSSNIALAWCDPDFEISVSLDFWWPCALPILEGERTLSIVMPDKGDFVVDSTVHTHYPSRNGSLALKSSCAVVLIHHMTHCLPSGSLHLQWLLCVVLLRIRWQVSRIL